MSSTCVILKGKHRTLKLCFFRCFLMVLSRTLFICSVVLAARSCVCIIRTYCSFHFGTYCFNNMACVSMRTTAKGYPELMLASQQHGAVKQNCHWDNSWKQRVREGMILQSSFNLLLLTWGTQLCQRKRGKFWKENECSEQLQLHAYNLLTHYLCIPTSRSSACVVQYLLCWCFLWPVYEQGLQRGYFLVLSHYQERDSSEQCSQKYNLHVCASGMKWKEIQEYRMLSSG